MNTEDMNYLTDQRNCKPDAPIILYMERVGEDGTYVDEIELPTTWVVCGVCEGKGTHVNPSIDCNGITAEEFAEDPDFEESYRRGDYDQQCNKCGGRTTVRGIDWDAMTPEQRTAYQKQCEEEAEDRACQLAEIRAGA